MYAQLPRQGPGSPKYTLDALSFTDLQNRNNPRILELGCGTGAATFALASYFPCNIIATDYYEIFLNVLKENIKKQTLKGKITPLQMDMKTKDISSNVPRDETLG